MVTEAVGYCCCTPDVTGVSCAPGVTLPGAVMGTISNRSTNCSDLATGFAMPWNGTQWVVADISGGNPGGNDLELRCPGGGTGVGDFELLSAAFGIFAHPGAGSTLTPFVLNFPGLTFGGGCLGNAGGGFDLVLTR